MATFAFCGLDHQAAVTASPVVCSGETSARVSGKTWWEWVFVGTLAVLHVIRPSRGKASERQMRSETFAYSHPNQSECRTTFRSICPIRPRRARTVST